ncbi:MAG TPA: dynamin family protein [Thermoanaerobaculia bacterium]|jgi:predicted GTPase
MSDETQEAPLVGAATVPRLATLPEDIDTLTDAVATCAFLRGIVDRHIPAEARRREHLGKLETIERRMHDPNLYLGVIGEFSSGKSTFINGLLRTRLLKAACVVTTASITRIRRGPELSVSARLDDGTEVVGTAENREALAAAVRSRQPELPQDASLTALLASLTSDPAVAGSVREIEVRFPSEHLDEGLVILDTPGIGAGASIAETHGSLTQRALKEVIDFAIVLIPSANALTSTLLDFLETYARPFLHRCLFVITAMDRQDDASRAEINAFVREKLAERLGLRDPWVVESAAIAMLPLPVVPESLRESLEYWQAQHESLEAAIKNALARQRTLIIAESLARLLSEVLEALNGDLLLRQSALAEEERRLQERSVEKIETLLGALRARSEADIRRQESSLRTQAAAQKEGHRAAAAKWIHDLIERTGKEGQAKLATAISEGVKHYGRTFVDSVNGELDRLRTVCESASSEFGRQFEASYRGLKTLGVSIAVPPLNIAPIPDSTLFSSGIQFAAKQDWFDANRKAGCATFGGLASVPLGCLSAVLGAIVGCCAGLSGSGNGDSAGAGLVIGGLLGFVIAIVIGAKSGAALGGLGGEQRQAERQRQLRQHIDPGIQTFFDQLQSDLDTRVRRSVDDVLKGFADAVARHIATYGEAVENLRREHEKNRRSLDEEMAQTSVDADELTWRRRHLDVLRQRLSTPVATTTGGAQ